MNTTYERLIQNLNVVKLELKNRNDSSLNLCIQYIKDAIIEAGRLNNELEDAKAIVNYRRELVDLDGDTND